MAGEKKMGTKKKLRNYTGQSSRAEQSQLLSSSPGCREKCEWENYFMD